MARLGSSGKNFSVMEDKLTIFGLPARPHGENWKLGLRIDDGKYIESIASPQPACGLIMEVLAEDTAQGKIMDIVRVDVSAHVAARLYLEGIIYLDQFKGAREGTHRINVGDDVNETIHADFVCLPSVQFTEHHSFPLYIYGEGDVGNVYVATINDEGKVV